MRRTRLGRKKIVLLAAAPVDASRLRLEQEIREIEAGLRAASLREDFQFQPVLATRTRDLQQALLMQEPQIVHFSGHGNQRGELILENDLGNAHPVPPDVLAELFSLCTDHVECILLNACCAETQAEAISTHIPYVIGSSGALDDHAAISFSIGFYTALGEGKSYTDAYRFGRSQFRLDFPSLPPPLLKEKTGGADARLAPREFGRMTRDQLSQLAAELKLLLSQGVEDADTHLSLGGVYLALKLYDLAIQHCKKAIDRDPSLADAYYLLALSGTRGRSLKHLPIQEVRALEGYLQTAIEIDDRRAQYYYLLALIKEGFYARNSLRVPPPAPGELMALARSKHPDPGEIKRLIEALPQLDSTLSLV